MTPHEIERRCRDAWTADGLSDKTIHAYLLVYRRAERAAAELGTCVLALTPSQVRQVAGAWPLTRGSRVQLRAALARVWEVCGAEGAPQAIPVPTKPHYRCRALDEPASGVLAAVATADRTSAGLAVLFGLYAGLRREEIARLEWGQCGADGWLRLVGKCNVSAEIPLHPALVVALARHESAGRYVFPGRFGGHVTPATVWTWSRRLGRTALGVHVPTHVLRHTAIATVHDATGDLRVAQEFARHRELSTTQIYTRVPKARLEQAVHAIDYGRSNHQ